MQRWILCQIPTSSSKTKLRENVIFFFFFFLFFFYFLSFFFHVILSNTLWIVSSRSWPLRLSTSETLVSIDLGWIFLILTILAVGASIWILMPSLARLQGAPSVLFLSSVWGLKFPALITVSGQNRQSSRGGVDTCSFHSVLLEGIHRLIQSRGERYRFLLKTKW